MSSYCKNYIFSRIENPYEKPYSTSINHTEHFSTLLINKPSGDYELTDKYFDKNIDEEYEQFIKKVKPDVVHIGHLSRLSTRIPLITAKYHIPMIYMIHDYWLFCVRGQLLSTYGNICDGPELNKCLKCLKVNYKSINSLLIKKIMRHMNMLFNYQLNIA